MSNKVVEVNAEQEVHLSILSNEKAKQHLGKIYECLAQLYREGEGDEEKLKPVREIDTRLVIFFQELEANVSRIGVMGKAIEFKNQTLAENDQEIAALKHILAQVQEIQSVYESAGHGNGHRKHHR